MFEIKLNFAGIHLLIQSDTPLPITNNPCFTPFFSKSSRRNAESFIFEIPSDSKTIDETCFKTDHLFRITGFQKRWTKVNGTGSPQLLSIFKSCSESPEFCHIEMAWDHIIINNFKQNKHYFFYSINRLKDIRGPLFLSGFRNFIRPIFINFSAVMLHGSGIIINDRVHIFLAPDEGGKTTISKNFSPQNVLSDDQIILKKENNIHYVYSTPFGSIGGGFKKCELGAFFLLKKDKRFNILKIENNDILKFVWDEHFLFTLTMPRNIRKIAFNFISEAVNGKPCYLLSFPSSGISLERLKNFI